MSLSTATLPLKRLKEFCRRRRIRRLSLFGSALRDDFRDDSDVDVLVEFAPGQVIGLKIVQIERELSELFAGAQSGFAHTGRIEPVFP